MRAAARRAFVPIPVRTLMSSRPLMNCPGAALANTGCCSGGISAIGDAWTPAASAITKAGTDIAAEQRASEQQRMTVSWEKTDRQVIRRGVP
jgi:hypothetical protein